MAGRACWRSIRACPTPTISRSTPGRSLLSRRAKLAHLDLFGTYHVKGYPPLCEAIARYLTASRGVEVQARADRRHQRRPVGVRPAGADPDR